MCQAKSLDDFPAKISNAKQSLFFRMKFSRCNFRIPQDFPKTLDISEIEFFFLRLKRKNVRDSVSQCRNIFVLQTITTIVEVLFRSCLGRGRGHCAIIKVTIKDFPQGARCPRWNRVNPGLFWSVDQGGSKVPATVPRLKKDFPFLFYYSES